MDGYYWGYLVDRYWTGGWFPCGCFDIFNEEGASSKGSTHTTELKQVLQMMLVILI